MSERPTVLVADDEPQMVGVIAYALQTAGFQVIMAYDGLQALQQVEEHHPDIVILDVTMPGVDGFEVCRRVRSETTIPVLLLTVKDEPEDVIKGLELGADDYMTKPFSTRELVLRVQAILRRTRIRQVTVVESGPLRIDFERHRVTLHELPIELTPLEYRLLTCLAANTGRVLTWQALLKEAWQLDVWQGSKEMIKVQIHRLRQKLEPNPAQPRFIHTVRGVGYRFDL
ncbi:MAG: response regulator transcription factor [Anaerolineae bacterium]|nr:response regulator transcription factor [Anaerolineae bacterium]